MVDPNRACPDLDRRGIVIAMVVKANSKGADFRPRVLRRLSKGAFVDLTDEFLSVCAAWDPTGRTSTPAAEAGRFDAVADLIRNITEGGRAGSSFTRQQLETEFSEKGHDNPALEGMIGDAAREKETSRDHLAHSLKQVSKAEKIKVQRNGSTLVKKLAPPTAQAA